jgi:glycerol-3-phosphate dehydrogenase subunit C
VCPSGVTVADIIQSARIKYDHAQPKLRDVVLANTDFMGKLARPFAPIVNGTTSLGVTKTILDATFAIDKHRTFPKYSGRSFERWLKRRAKEQAKFEKQVAYYHGCYVNYNYPQLGKDFVKVMNALGIGVQLLDKEKCCGVALIANGMSKKATKNAKHNVEVLQKAVDTGLKVLTTSSTCTMTIREEYPGLLQVDNSGIKDSVLLATRYIYQLIESGQAQLKFKENYRARIAYHIPCHLEKLGWGIFSTELLKMIPGVEFTLLDSNCCGISGTYGFKKENYEASQAIGKPLFDQIKSVNPDFVACDCETCKWQLEMSTPYKVKHPISILAEALDV